MNRPGNLYVEPHARGGYAVKRAGAKRAIAVLPTQAEAIARAEGLEPEGKPNVARVRTTPGGPPDEFRKA